jgi:hypothetical protein
MAIHGLWNKRRERGCWLSMDARIMTVSENEAVPQISGFLQPVVTQSVGVKNVTRVLRV